MNPLLKPFPILSILILGLLPVAFCQSNFQSIRDRVVQKLLQPPVDEQQIHTLLSTLREEGTWPGIDYQDVSRTGFEHRRHLAHMVDLARAYTHKASPVHQKERIKQSIDLALKNWVENDYFCDNWWHNQIGTPNGLVSLMLLMGKDLDPALVAKAQPIIGRAHIDAPGARPGGDRIKIAGIQAKNALFTGDMKTFDEVVRVIEGEIKFSDWVGVPYGYGFRHIPTGFSNRQMGGRGIQHDYSFHHRVDGVTQYPFLWPGLCSCLCRMGCLHR